MEDAKLGKGTWGYIERWKRKKLLTVFVWVIFILLSIGIPELVFHSRYNAFTIAGIIMVLPAARHLVQYLSVLKFHSGSRENYEKIQKLVEGKEWMTLLSDVILAGETGHMVLDMLIISNGNMYGYGPKQSKDRETIEKCLADILAEEDFHKRPVVHEDFDEFEEMVMMLAANEPSQPASNHCLIELVKALSI